MNHVNLGLTQITSLKSRGDQLNKVIILKNCLLLVKILELLKSMKNG